MDPPLLSRIVIVGTSKMTLNERFSKLPPPRIPRLSVATPQYRRAALNYNEPFVSARSDAVDSYEDDLLLQDDDIADDGVEYIPQYRVIPRRPRGKLAYSTRTPVRERISYSVLRRSPYVSSRGYVLKNSFTRGQRYSNGTIRMRTSRQIRQPSYGNVAKFSVRRQNGLRGKRETVFVNRGRGGRGVRSGTNMRNAKRKPVSKEQLDKELDEYMKKGKHPPIDVSDLMQN
ncbi:hypothetical protein AB6A40_002888 [Gnathostoma spinigerum]|uniref:Chromatin target of PRMT1 protein C-terminal domain-containing protein n=1 Tax=Gnathostoma spinigerum TaxID=75299 RepID=A0ABD6EDF3_9BILA